MTLKTRIEAIERRRALESELACGLTACDAYLAILDRRDLTFEEDPDKPGFYRLIKRPPRAPGSSLSELLGRPPTPQEVYDYVTGKLDVKALVVKR